MQKFTVFLALVTLFLVGCMAEPNTVAHIPAADGSLAGFWRGWWHGFIVPVSWICSLFSDNVGLYEIHNNGGWYNFGYMLGVATTIGGSSTAASK